MEKPDFLINTLYNFSELSVNPPHYLNLYKLISRSGELGLIDHMASNKGCNNCYLGIRYLSDTAAAMDILFSDTIVMPIPEDDYMLLSFDVTIENDNTCSANGATLFRIQESGVPVLFTEPPGIMPSKYPKKRDKLAIGWLKTARITKPFT